MFNEFKTICIANGFRCRGKAFFRVVGDGVLQVLKYDKSHVPYNPMLLVGLFSIYGEIDPLWLTSKGCIPRYWIYNLAYPFDPTAKFLLMGPDMREQMAVLTKHGFLWLNSITDQAALVDAICKLDVSARGSISWNDMEKFAPLLRSRNFMAAEKVIQAHINQYLAARERNPNHINEATAQRYVADMCKFERMLELVQSRDTRNIDAYLSSNYTANMELVKFCRKRC